MITFGARCRIILEALVLAFLLTLAASADAQQPSSVNPDAAAVKEQQLLQQSDTIKGRGTIPDVKSYIIEHPTGRAWRAFHEVTLPWLGALAILGIVVLLVIFYLRRGMVRIESGRSGRTIVRFNAFERFVHWLTATCFIIQALSGLNITFGKRLLLPLIGPASFSTMSQWMKFTHDFVSFPFTVGVILIFMMWLGGNVPARGDLEWLKQGGGIIGHNHPTASRFNAGQKITYWVVVLGGAAMAISGYVLLFPFYGTNINNMESAQMVHGIIAMLFIAVMIAHIYVGTIGMEGAFEGMATGEVDLNWAREHHRLWLEEELRRDRTSGAPPRIAPAE